MPTSFIPEFWSAEILQALETNLVFGNPGIVNRDYEGEIRDAGDTVRINAVGDVEISTYTRGASLGTPDEVESAQQLLLIDQAKKFNFRVDDLDALQANANFAAEAQRRAGYGLRKACDSFLAETMSGDVADANILSSGSTIDVGTGASDTNAYELLVDLGVVLDEADVPEEGRWVIVSPGFHGLLQKDDRFVSFGTGSNAETLRGGRVGSAAGFMVAKSNQLVTNASDDVDVLAGHPIATTFAQQVIKTETLRSETYMADIIRGLHVYGAKVVRPGCLAKAIVDINA